ncbi:unnamed protein product [Chironomus riparius]|uniref:Peptidase S1 domain-containing protein n=1 Tax=Chironomus riparius TaxID=315576 RepID=A0A9N9RZZ6_9DIPT|nr:unnamed protein product [Chironomus riparius]
MESIIFLIYVIINLYFCKSQLVFSGTSGGSVSPTIMNNPCICVVAGYCSRVNGSTSSLPTDGSGLIDVRIINSGFGGSTNTGSSTSPASTGISTMVVSQSSCQAGLEVCCLSSGYRCGLRFPPIQGAPSVTFGQAPYGSYPWFALIFQQYTNIYVGSGVLIDHMHILTVAHKISNYTLTPTSLKVRLGEWNLAPATEPITPIEFNVVRIFIHPQFNSQSIANSIAILRVSPDVPLGQTPTITTGCLSTNYITGGRCWVAGYGEKAFTSGSTPTIMQHVELPIVNQVTCQNLLRSTRLGSGFILDPISFLCAGGIPGRDACTGDGGSALMCFANSQWYIAGLVAWGIGCGSSNVPGVYMNVTNYINWIQTTTIQP